MLRHFVGRGIHCVAPDLPGHGHSDEVRGFIPSLEAVDAIVLENLAWVREQAGRDVPAGLLGHSMGGFLTLNHLSRHPGNFEFAYTSSPLIDARWNKSRWLQLLARVLNHAWPRFSVANGIAPAACRRDPARIREAERDRLMHRRVSMRLGRLLLRASEELPQIASRMDTDLSLLITHGSDDPVCPSELSYRLFRALPVRDKQFALLDGLLHEPFNDLGSDAYFDSLTTWLRQLDLAPGRRAVRAA